MNGSIADETNAPPLDDLDAQVACFRQNSYVVLPGLIPPGLLARLNEAIDRDRKANPFLWWWQGSPNNTSNLLLTEPLFDDVTRLPRVLALLERLMGGPATFEELSVQVTEPGAAAPTAWHRDRDYWRAHPLHLDFPQVIAYLTDVDETAHCFTISPEPADGEIIDDAREQVARRGTVYLHGKAGAAIFFNCAAVHGLTRRETASQRRILQLYYGHESRSELSQATLFPPRLWRDHPDPEVRRFFSKRNRLSRVVHEGLGVPYP